MEIEFGILSRDELKESVELAARAYEYYEYFTNFFPDLRERRKVLRSIMYRVMLTNFGHTHFLTAKVDGKMVALAQVDDAQYKRPSVLQFLLHGWLMVYCGVKMKRVNAWLAMDAVASKPCHDFQKTSPDIWYTCSVTVDPDFQRKGIGSKFIGFWEDYIRERGGKELILFTNSEKNLAFYKKNGFEVFDEREIPIPNERKMKSWSVRKTL
jgi:ribosomal protein S18 acetylase RimI-like enzyme